MIWTHIFDLLAKLASMALAVSLLLLSLPNPPAKGEPILFVFFFITGALVWWFALRPLSSWLHARVRLGARLSWAQARRASMLFSPVPNLFRLDPLQDLLVWHPLWEVRHLPEVQRAAAIEEALENLQAEQKARDELLRARSVGSHALRWMYWVAFAVILVLTLGNLPPASWVSEFQARVFDGAYYPLLTAVILMLPVGGLLIWLDNAITPRKVTAINNPSLTDNTPPPAAISPFPPVAVTPPVETEKVIDPNDHSRFAPPSN
jgi:hypothetical protein